MAMVRMRAREVGTLRPAPLQAGHARCTRVSVDINCNRRVRTDMETGVAQHSSTRRAQQRRLRPPERVLSSVLRHHQGAPPSKVFQPQQARREATSEVPARERGGGAHAGCRQQRGRPAARQGMAGAAWMPQLHTLAGTGTRNARRWRVHADVSTRPAAHPACRPPAAPQEPPWCTTFLRQHSN